jgi:glyceraldehyde-3-phosphate dehydrogenase (NADP+)
VEVDRAAHTFQIAAEEARRFGGGETIPLDRAASSSQRWGITRRFPAGVVGAITPFNFPLNLVAHKVAPALAAACPVVLKPAHQTPLTALNLAEIVAETSLPPGSLNVVHTEPVLGTMLATDDRVAVLSFTGSGRVGWELKARASAKKVILELGGNAAVIVDETADIDRAAARCAAGGYAYAGQVCISAQRVLVQETVYDRFTERFLAAVANLAVGDPAEPGTVVGPMISAEAAARVAAWVADALAGGARLLAGDGRANGRWLRPVVVEGAQPTDAVEAQEIFGPVVSLTRYAAFDDAIARVNASAFGLQAGVFTADLARAHHAFERLAVGAVIVNDSPAYRVDHMPYGGVKGSGCGREGVRYAVDEMSELRLMVVGP